MAIQKALNPGEHPLELRTLSGTRWVCRVSALRTIKIIPALKQFLKEIMQKDPLDAAARDAAI